MFATCRLGSRPLEICSKRGLWQCRRVTQGRDNSPCPTTFSAQHSRYGCVTRVTRAVRVTLVASFACTALQFQPKALANVLHAPLCAARPPPNRVYCAFLETDVGSLSYGSINKGSSDRHTKTLASLSSWLQRAHLTYQQNASTSLSTRTQIGREPHSNDRPRFAETPVHPCMVIVTPLRHTSRHTQDEDICHLLPWRQTQGRLRLVLVGCIARNLLPSLPRHAYAGEEQGLEDIRQYLDHGQRDT